jgi:hypothetical protein
MSRTYCYFDFLGSFQVSRLAQNLCLESMTSLVNCLVSMKQSDIKKRSRLAMIVETKVEDSGRKGNVNGVSSTSHAGKSTNLPTRSLHVLPNLNLAVSAVNVLHEPKFGGREFLPRLGAALCSQNQLVLGSSTAIYALCTCFSKAPHSSYSRNSYLNSGTHKPCAVWVSYSSFSSLSFANLPSFTNTPSFATSQPTVWF